MADKTLYDVLEVSSTDSSESIRAAFGRLSAKFGPDNPGNAANPEARVQHDAIKAAFLTLDNPEKRKQYDLYLERKWAVLHNVEVVQPFWTLPKVALIAIALAVGYGVYYSYQNVQKEQDRVARVRAEKAIAAAKAREAAARANLEAVQAREEAERRALQAMSDSQRREYEAELARKQAELNEQMTGYKRTDKK